MQSEEIERKKEAATNTVYDDVFRTLLTQCSSLIIPVVNEAFGEKYTGKEKIELRQNEHFESLPGSTEQKRITDSNFTITSEDGKTKRYQVECQSTPDNTMVVRMFEYAIQVGLENSEIKNNTLRVQIPNSCVLYLRSNEKTPNKLTVRIEAKESNMEFTVPIVKTQEYSSEQLIDKKLLFLVPFYLFSHESRLEEYNRDEKLLDKELLTEYRYIKRKLEEMLKNKELTLFQEKTIEKMSGEVTDKLAHKFDNVKEGVDSIMGGQVLDYEAATIREQGIEEGRELGREEGRAKGREEGREQGREEGREEGMKMSAVRMREGGMKAKDISRFLQTDEKKIREWIGEPEEPVKAKKHRDRGDER